MRSGRSFRDGASIRDVHRCTTAEHTYGADLSMPRVGDDPVARQRRGGRMIDRRERPSSIVRPEPNFSKMELARSSAGGASGSR